jgi:hypothetical protein
VVVVLVVSVRAVESGCAVVVTVVLEVLDVPVESVGVVVLVVTVLEGVPGLAGVTAVVVSRVVVVLVLCPQPLRIMAANRDTATRVAPAVAVAGSFVRYMVLLLGRMGLSLGVRWATSVLSA